MATDQADETAKRLAAAEAERDLAKAQLETLRARQALQAGQETSAYDLALARDAADNKRLRTQADRLKINNAMIGDAVGATKPSGFSGGISVDGKAGGGEVSLLAAQAVDRAAIKIAASLKPKVPSGRRAVLLPGRTAPTFASLRLFEARTKAAANAFVAAAALLSDAEDLQSEAGELDLQAHFVEFGAATAAGAVLESAAKIGSYFQTDIKAGALGPTGIDDDYLLVAVASHLMDSSLPSRWPTTVFPSTSETLTKLAAQCDETIQRCETCRRHLASLDKADQKFDALTAAVEAAAARGAAAQARYDNLLSWLAEPDATGLPALSHVIAEADLESRLTGGDIAILLSVTPLGGYYTVRNLWSFLWSLPFFVMSGALVSFTAFDKSGTVLAAGHHPIHSGYQKVSKVAKIFSIP